MDTQQFLYLAALMCVLALGMVGFRRVQGRRTLDVCARLKNADDLESSLQVLKAQADTRKQDPASAPDAGWLDAADVSGDMARAMSFLAAGAVDPRQIAEGVAILEAAAEKGSAPAQCELGRLYLSGMHVAQDRVRGREWLAKAAAQGFPPALLALARTHAEDDDGDPAQAYALALQAAEKGFTPAFTLLADALRKGQGVPADSTAAVRWYREALLTSGGRNSLARLRLAEMYLRGDGVPANPLHAFHMLQHPSLTDQADIEAVREGVQAMLSDADRQLLKEII